VERKFSLCRGSFLPEAFMPSTGPFEKSIISVGQNGGMRVALWAYFKRLHQGEAI
jgi:hypothetical protein